jgi:hypothetical protein
MQAEQERVIVGVAWLCTSVLMLVTIGF